MFAVADDQDHRSQVTNVPNHLINCVYITILLATFRVALHYVRFDNYHAVLCDAMLWLNSDSLRWNLTRDLLR